MISYICGCMAHSPDRYGEVTFAACDTHRSEKWVLSSAKSKLQPCAYSDKSGLSLEKEFGPDDKNTNPKDAIGADKLPLHLWPATATAMGSVGMAEGMIKYGRSNFRAIGVRASIYIDACKRHLDAWFEGEENAPDSGVPHLANALACIAIIIDATAAGKLNDDRQITGGYRRLVEELTPHIKRLKELHKDKHPHHYTIADNPNE